MDDIVKNFVVMRTGTSKPKEDKPGKDYSRLEEIKTSKSGDEWIDEKSVKFLPGKLPMFSRYKCTEIWETL